MKSLRNKRLLAWIGHRLRPLFNYAGTYLYRQGDEISVLIIVMQGLSCFVAPKYHNQIFAVIKGGESVNKGDQTLQHIGYEDSVVNHLLLIKDIENNDWDDHQLVKRQSTSILSKRFFTIQCIKHMESLTLSFADLDMMKRDFKGQSTNLFLKKQIEQTCTILIAMMRAVQNFGQTQGGKLFDGNEQKNMGEEMLRYNYLNATKYMDYVEQEPGDAMSSVHWTSDEEEDEDAKSADNKRKSGMMSSQVQNLFGNDKRKRKALCTA